ncbi:uncharacterized protein [Acropora muricata]|uniref:uncharacterized protein n=1 Tax=Acropora muricata TaxID=159855 RepID=UPI0034E56293
MCPQKNSRVHTVTPSQDGAIGRQRKVQTEGLFIGTVTSVKTDSAWFSTVTVGGLSDKFKLDPGAEANVLPLSVYSELQTKSSLMDTSVVLSSYGDFKIKPAGKVTLVYEAQGLKESLSFFVAAVNSKPILGLSACSKLNLVKRVERISQAPCTKKEIVDNFDDVFSGLGCTKGKDHIELDDSVQPVIHPP